MQYEKCSPTAIPAVREHFTYFLYELIGCLIILIVDGMHLRHQFVFLQSSACTECFQGIIIIPELSIHITQQNHWIFGYHLVSVLYRNNEFPILNIGSPYLLDGIDENGEIKTEAQSQVMDDLRGHFRPEFLNRLDEIIMFKPLTKSNIGKIVDLMVGELDKRLADQELSLELTDAAKDQVIENGYDPVYGARPLKRYLQKYVETLAARKILSGDVHAGDTLVLDVQNGEFIVTVKDGN